MLLSALETKITACWVIWWQEIHVIVVVQCQSALWQVG